MKRRVSAAVLVCVLVAPAGADAPLADLAAHGHWKRLKALVETRAAANPNDAAGQWLLLRVRAAYRDFDGALPPAEKAVALDRGNATTSGSSPRSSASSRRAPASSNRWDWRNATSARSRPRWPSTRSTPKR